MDVQVKHLEGHAAQLTVTMDADKTEESKKRAARRLAKNVRIPGFRPGKAPYHVIQTKLGEDAILEEVADMIVQDVYRDALEQSELRPAAPGAFIDIKEVNGQLELIYQVPKKAEADLKDYRSLRMPLEVEEVTDQQVTDAMEALRENRAVVEEVQREARIGDELGVELVVSWWHDHDHDEDEDDSEEAADVDEAEMVEDAEVESDEDDYEDDYEDEHDHESGHEHVLIDEEDTSVVVREPDDDRDMLPGFSAHLIGLRAGDEAVFSLELSDDFEDETLAGKTVDVELTVNRVSSRTLPELNDTFAASATNGEHETLLDLRVGLRNRLGVTARERAEDALFEKVVDQLVEEADIQFNEADVEAYLDRMMDSMDAFLKDQMGMALQDFRRITGQSQEQLRAHRRDDAVKTLKRDTVIYELVRAEKLRVSNEEIEAEIDRLVAQFGQQSAQFRRFFESDESRTEIGGRLLLTPAPLPPKAGGEGFKGESRVARVRGILCGKSFPAGRSPRLIHVHRRTPFGEALMPFDSHAPVSRRGFLRTAAVASGAALVAPRLALAESTQDPYGGFKMGLQSYSLRGYKDPKVALEHTKALGLKYWEAYPAHVPMSSVPKNIQDQKEMLAAAGVTLMAYGVLGFDANETAARQKFDFAKAIGIVSLSADPKKDKATFDLLDKLVAEYDVAIAIHNHGPGAQYDKISDVETMVKDRHPKIGACVDTGHYLRSDEDPVEAIERLGKRVFGVHLKDVKTIKNGDKREKKFTIAGLGDLNVLGCLKALRKLDYKYCLALEYEENPSNPLEDIEACLQHVREQAAKV